MPQHYKLQLQSPGICRVLTDAGLHVGNLKRIGGAWKFKAIGQGFNGGLLRMPQMRLMPGQMKALRTGLVSSGFQIPDDDGDFYAGRVQ